MHLITQFHEHRYPPIRLDKKQSDSLGSKIRFFQRFLEDHHTTIDRELEIRIADAAHAAEDLIETHIADRVLDFYGSLQRVIEGLDLIKKELIEMNLNEQSQQQGNNRPTQHPTPPASSNSPPTNNASGENIVVGIEDITTNIVDKLTSSQHNSYRQIISISGMGGIGKTTLARKIYDHPYIKNYFDFFAWATISKDYNTRESLVEILHCLDRSKKKENLRKNGEYDLGEQLYKYLIGRRYLVILDDVWDFEAWERLQSFFPTSTSGGGIVITARESKFASISSHSFRMDLLDEHKSWDLFCKHVFGQDCCPVELESVGKKISKKCRGLPLSIVVIGSHLAKSPRKPEYWENVTTNISSVDDDHCLRIVSLSYTHLPVHLKPCFLYMAIFPEDEEIKVPKLVKLWVAEGFVKPIDGKNLEDTARNYLSDLVSRNLILAKESSRGKIKKCKIHDVLRDFCLKEVSKTNFICTVQKVDDLRVLNNERRIVVHPSAIKEAASEKQGLLESVIKKFKKIICLNDPMVNHHLDISIVLQEKKLLRSLIYHEGLNSLENKLLRVVAPFFEDQFVSQTLLPQVLHELVNMRHFESCMFVTGDFYKLPSSISLPWNLQSLTIFTPTVLRAPPEVWNMPQLRHIRIGRNVALPHPRSEESNDIIMENLQSARTIVNFNFCKDVVKRIPSIKKLHVSYDDRYEGYDEGLCTLKDVDLLQKLESFECCTYTRDYVEPYHMLRNLNFPRSIKKLSLTNLYWDDVTTKIGWLPLLEVLKLLWFRGHEWELVDGQFVKLKILKLHGCSLRHFKADNNHLPCLHHLVLNYMYNLEGISSDIGDIPTLKSIKLKHCNDLGVISAKEIAVEQYENGNYDLQVSAKLDKDKPRLSGSFSTCNFHCVSTNTNVIGFDTSES